MKNILLLFVSKINATNPKLNYLKYNFNGIPEETLQTNESAVKFLAANLPSGKFDAIFAFESQEVGNKLSFSQECFSQYNGCSSVEVLKERIQGLYTETNYFPCPYDEKNSTAASLKEMTEMSNLILKFKENNPGEIALYADMTGGMRNASMMMLGIMRFLENSGIQIKDVVYSDSLNLKVDSAKSIYMFFDLVAGAKEFINYGSIAELTKYFATIDDNEKSPELKNLITAMQDFAAQIKLCHYGDFKTSIQELQKAYLTFKNKNSNNINDNLAKIMIQSIGKEYDLLFSENYTRFSEESFANIKKDLFAELDYNQARRLYHDLIDNLSTDFAKDLDYIQWCLDHDYLQQAMTLYTERVPLYIKGTKIMLPNFVEPELLKVYDDLKKESPYLDPGYFLCTNPPGSSAFCSIDKIKKEVGKIFLNIIQNPDSYIEQISNETSPKEIINLYLKTFSLKEATIKNLKDASQYFEIKFSNLQNFKNTLKNLIIIKKSKEEEFQSFIKGNQPVLLKILYNQASLRSPLKTITKKFFLNYCKSTLSYKGVLELQIIKFSTNSLFTAEEKVSCIPNCIDKGWIICNKERKQQLLDIIRTYTQIRYIRNSSNHAHDEKSPYTPEEISSIMKEGIKKLKEEANYAQ